MLLVRDDVGKAKPSTSNLPSGDFTYGKVLPRDREGAALGKINKLTRIIQFA